MGSRKKNPARVEAELLILSRRRCALCFGLKKSKSERKGQIAHLDRNPVNNLLDNLVYLCLEHHDAYDSRTSQSKRFTRGELRHYRDDLYRSHVPSKRSRIELDKLRSIDQFVIDFENLKYLWTDTRSLVFAGLVPNDEIVKEILEMYTDEIPPEKIRPIVEVMTWGLLEEHKMQQALWPAVTDCDRLELAFASLERRGIICRRDFTYCLSDGYNEIWDEVDREVGSGKVVRGFAFFHMQDTEHALQDGDLALGYGSLLDEEVADVAIGKEVAAIIEGAGLRVHWNGSIKRRILVTLDWKRRR